MMKINAAHKICVNMCMNYETLCVCLNSNVYCSSKLIKRMINIDVPTHAKVKIVHRLNKNRATSTLKALTWKRTRKKYIGRIIL